MTWIFISAVTLYFGIGVFIASCLLHHKDRKGLILTTMFWPLALLIGILTK